MGKQATSKAPKDDAALVREAKAILAKRGEAQARLDEIAREREPITLKDVCKDRCNFDDSSFEADVSRFVDRYMPGLDSATLDREDSDVWDLHPGSRFEVREVEAGFAVWDTESGTWTDPDLAFEDNGVDAHRDAYGGGEVLPEDVAGEHEFVLFAEVGHAEQAAHEMNRADSGASYAFPFAWLWCWMPDDVIEDADLHAAGFIVYTYTGGDDGEQRIAGIDGAGYSFKGAHFAPLYARVAARCGWLVQTDSGPRRIAVAGVEEEW